jgi:hypothetical protein
VGTSPATACLTVGAGAVRPELISAIVTTTASKGVTSLRAILSGLLVRLALTIPVATTSAALMEIDD